MKTDPAIMPRPIRIAANGPPGKPANGPATITTPPPMNRAMAAMKKPKMVPTTPMAMGSRIRMSMAPRPSTAKTAPAAAEGFFS